MRDSETLADGAAASGFASSTLAGYRGLAACLFMGEAGAAGFDALGCANPSLSAWGTAPTVGG